MHKFKNIAEEFNWCDQRRNNKLERAREAASYTIPALLPDPGTTNESDLPVWYSSIGAKGVASLASKIVSAIYPLNDQPFYGFDIQKFDSLGNDDQVVVVREELAKIERKILDRFASSNYRAALFTAVQHLIVVGDCLLYLNDKGNFQVYRLDQYVVRRRPDGQVVTVILREWVDPDLLPPHLAIIPSTGVYQWGGVSAPNPQLNYEPHFCKLTWSDEKKVWKVSKEFREVEYESDKQYKITPYWPLRWQENVTEDYGRSLVEENIGEFRTTEGLAKSLVELSAAIAEFRIGVDPGGITKISDLEESENGQFVPAKEGEVFAIRAELENAVQHIHIALKDREASLGRVFLMDSAVQPQGERVTAYQVSVLSNELQSVLNAPLTTLSREVQYPSVLRMIEIMRQNSEIPANMDKILENDLVSIRIRTGLEALNKEIQLQKQTMLAEIVLRLPEQGQTVMDWSGFVREIWTNAGADPTGVILTREEEAQKRQELQAQAVQAMAAEQAIKSAGAVAESQAQGGGNVNVG